MDSDGSHCKFKTRERKNGRVWRRGGAVGGKPTCSLFFCMYSSLSLSSSSMSSRICCNTHKHVTTMATFLQYISYNTPKFWLNFTVSLVLAKLKGWWYHTADNTALVAFLTIKKFDESQHCGPEIWSNSRWTDAPNTHSANGWGIASFFFSLFSWFTKLMVCKTSIQCLNNQLLACFLCTLQSKKHTNRLVSVVFTHPGTFPPTSGDLGECPENLPDPI